MPPLLLRLIFSVLPARSPALLRPLVRSISRRAIDSYIDPQIKTHFDFIESELTKSTWFAGDDFSAADVMMSFPLGGGGRPRRAYRADPHKSLRGAFPCATGLPAGAREGRALCLCVNGARRI